MSWSPPGVRRVAAILNFMADHPGQAFALSDFVRALNISPSSCHGLLTGLVDVGYLYRTSDKTYVFGPVLSAIGRTARDHISLLRIAKPEMRSIADEFDVVCGAYSLEGDMMHLREQATSANHVSYPAPLGARIPLTAVQVTVFFARAPKDAAAWLVRNISDATPERKAGFFAGLEFVREEGYLPLIRRYETASQLDIAPLQMLNARDDPVLPLLLIDDAAFYSLVAIMAPVYDERGRVPLSLLVGGFDGVQTGAQVRKVGARLSSACQSVSDFLCGRTGTLEN